MKGTEIHLENALPWWPTRWRPASIAADPARARHSSNTGQSCLRSSPACHKTTAGVATVRRQHGRKPGHRRKSAVTTPLWKSEWPMVPYDASAAIRRKSPVTMTVRPKPEPAGMIRPQPGYSDAKHHSSTATCPKTLRRQFDEKYDHK